MNGLKLDLKKKRKIHTSLTVYYWIKINNTHRFHFLKANLFIIYNP